PAPVYLEALRADDRDAVREAQMVAELLRWERLPGLIEADPRDAPAPRVERLRIEVQLGVVHGAVRAAVAADALLRAAVRTDGAHQRPGPVALRDRRGHHDAAEEEVIAPRHARDTGGRHEAAAR